jgi:hypothetical protein
MAIIIYVNICLLIKSNNVYLITNDKIEIYILISLKNNYFYYNKLNIYVFF